MPKYERRRFEYLFGSIVFDNDDDDGNKLGNYYSFAILRLQLSDFFVFRGSFLLHGRYFRG